jgi:uncharacterized coiled-coil protein SlyX
MNNNSSSLLASPPQMSLNGTHNSIFPTVDHSSMMSLPSLASTVPALQEQVISMHKDLTSKQLELDKQNALIHSLYQKLNEINSKKSLDDEVQRSLLKSRDEILSMKKQEMNHIEEEYRKLKDELLNEFGVFFKHMSQIEEAINSTKCKEETFSDRITSLDVHELFELKKALRNYAANCKMQVKNKYDHHKNSHQLSLMRNTMDMSSLLGTGSVGGLAAVIGSSHTSPNSRFTLTSAENGLSDLMSDSFSLTGSTSTAPAAPAAPAVVSSMKICGYPECHRSENLYECTGCHKISYCGTEHQQ